MGGIPELTTVPSALDFCVRGAEERIALKDYEMAAIFAAIGHSYLDHPVSLLLADDLPWNHLRRRLARVRRETGPAPAEAGDFIEGRIDRYLKAAEIRLRNNKLSWHEALQVLGGR